MMHQETTDYTAQALDGSQPFDVLTQPIPDSFPMSAQNSKQGEESYSMHSTPSPSPPSGTEQQRGAGRQRSKSGTGHLTMQQLNKKRQRATAEQLVVLEEAFSVNASPNAKMREMIAERIRMTERSVQIWFQNRRAKVKQMQSKEKGVENSMFYPGINGSPGMMDHMKRSALMRSNSVGHNVGYGALPPDIRYGLRMGFNGPLTPAASPSSKTVITRLTIETLSIGGWHRVACSSMDLVCYFSAIEGRFTYYINNSATGFKIEYPVSSIAGIKMEHMVRTDPINGNGTPLREEAKHRARIMIELTQSPLFFSETRGGGGWQHCHDFTQGLVASQIFLHTLVGPYDILRNQMQELAAMSPDLAARLVFDDQPQFLSFDDDERTAGTQADRTRRHSSTSTMAAPPRPASAMPSPFARQHLTPGPVPQFNPSLQGPRVRQSFQAHRRTRSRSLPTSVNVSDLALAASQHIGSNVVPGMKFGQEVNHYMPLSHDMLYTQQTPLRIDTSVADQFEYYRAFTPSSNMSSLTPVDYMSSPASQVPLQSSLPFYEGNQYEQVNPNYAHSALYSTENVEAPTIYTEEVSQPGMMNLDQYPQESFSYGTDPSTLQDTYTAVTDQQWNAHTPQVTVTSQMDGVESKEIEHLAMKPEEGGEGQMELAE